MQPNTDARIAQLLSRAVRVSMFVYGDVLHDSRVLREAGTLASAGFQVTVVARPSDTTSSIGRTTRRDGFDVLEVPIPGGWRRPWRIFGAPLRWLARLIDRVRPGHRVAETLTWLVIRRFGVDGWARAAGVAAPAPDIAHGHDLTGLAAAVDAGRRRRALVVYDSHEIALESGGYVLRPGWIRRRLANRERGWIDECTALVTVNEAILAELRTRYRLPATSIAVHNCPPRWDPPLQRDDRLRAAAGCPAEAPLAVYHGSFAPHRGLDELAAALLEPGLEAVHAVYLGFGRELAHLERLAAEPRFGGRLHVVAPVAPADLVPWLSGADVAVMPIQPNTLNHVLSTPNKLFEALAAGVPIVASDFPAMRSILLGNPAGPLGAVCDPADPAAIAAAIRDILGFEAAARADLRQRCLAAAHDRWNWETEGAKLVAVYRDLAGVGA